MVVHCPTEWSSAWTQSITAVEPLTLRMDGYLWGQRQRMGVEQPWMNDIGVLGISGMKGKSLGLNGG